MPIALEVIATTVDDAVAAEQGGAARVELVRSLDRGGLSPPLELVDAVLAHVRVPVRVMVRESESHEVPNPVIRARLVVQARSLGQRRVDGLVFGALADGRIDEALLDAVSGAAGLPVTFHRAFEDLTDPRVRPGCARPSSGGRSHPLRRWSGRLDSPGGTPGRLE